MSSLQSCPCKRELDNLGRPTRSEGHSSRGTWRTAVEVIRRLLANIIGAPQWRGPERKHLGGCGFETRRACLTHYCVVRTDLPLGALGAQLIHAAGESSPGDLPDGTFAIALAAKSLAHLEHLERKLLRLEIPHQSIREPDAPWNGELMAIGITPVEDRELVKPVTSGLRLLK